MAKSVGFQVMTWSLWKNIWGTDLQFIPYGQFIVAVQRRRDTEALDRPISLWSKILRSSLIIFAFSGLWVFAVPLLPLLLPFYIAGLGAWCANETANAIASERTRKRIDTVSVLPIGTAGVIWTITRTTLRKLELITRTNSLFANLSILGLFSIFGFTVVNAISVRLALIIVLFVVAIYFDFVQSVLIGCVIGIFTSLIDSDRVSVSTLSVLQYFCVHLLIYVTAATVLVIISNRMTTSLADYMLRITLIGIIALPLLREAILQSLWYWLTFRLETTRQEMSQLVQKGNTPPSTGI